MRARLGRGRYVPALMLDLRGASDMSIDMYSLRCRSRKVASSYRVFSVEGFVILGFDMHLWNAVMLVVL